MLATKGFRFLPPWTAFALGARSDWLFQPLDGDNPASNLSGKRSDTGDKARSGRSVQV